jgi:hypothetical protein
MGNLIKDYKKPTPVKWRKIGDSILLATLALSPMVMQLPLSEHQIIWVNFGLQAFGVIGKVITNFFKEEVEEI